jgi:hypothetical protein
MRRDSGEIAREKAAAGAVGRAGICLYICRSCYGSGRLRFCLKRMESRNGVLRRGCGGGGFEPDNLQP